MRFTQWLPGLMYGLLLTVLACPLAGQTVQGRISGTVADPSGTAVPGAQISLTNLDTGAKRATVTGNAGNYVLESVPPGRYMLEVQRAGFETYRISDLVLEVNESRTANVSLRLGTVTQSVDVKAAPLAVNTTNATVSQTIQQQEIVELPLNGRNFTQLTLLTPGASPLQGGQQTSFDIIPGNVTPAVNGMRFQMNDFTLDGADNNMRFTNTTAQVPPPDAIEEFSVESHQTGAEASFAAGATVNIVTRPGTNDFHASLWEFLRNDKLNANGFFNNFFSNAKVPFKQNQFGFFVGGPVMIPHVLDGRKSRTYFAGYYEGFRLRQSSVTQAEVPDAAERAGNFSELLGATTIGTDCLGRPVYKGEIYDFSTTVANSACPQGYIRNPYANNTIPNTQINSIATAYLNGLYPMPNRSTAPNLDLVQSLSQNQWQWGTRVDHSFSETDTLFGRVSQYNSFQESPGALPLNTLQRLNFGLNAVVHETHIFSPTFLGDFLFAYDRASVPYRYTPPGAAFDASIGTAVGMQTGIGFEPASQLFSGSAFNGVSFYDYELANPDYTYQYNADFKKITGKHDMGFGFRLMPFRHVAAYQGQASMTYVNTTTGLPGNNSTGEALASFMIGLPNASNLNIFEPISLHGIIYIGYWGDVWKVRRNLTVNLGLQYVYATPPVVNGNTISNFDLARALTQPTATDFSFAYDWCAKNPITGAAANCTRPSIQNPDRTDFAPRLGIAYNPLKNTVIRTGFGLYYDFNQNIVQGSARALNHNYPFSPGRSVSGENLYTLGPITPDISLNSPFLPATAVAGPATAISPNDRDPYAMEWNFGIQQILPGQMKLSVDYVGSGARKLVEHAYGNTAVLGAGSIASRRPLPNAGVFSLQTNDGTSNYDALEITLEKPLSSGLTLLNSYTWSKCFDIGSDATAIPIEYIYNPFLSYGPCDFNLPQMNVTSLVYQLPVGRGRKFASAISKPLDELIGGWQLSTIVTLRSGVDFTMLSGSDNANIGGTGEYAQIVSPVVPSGFTQNRFHWFNTTAVQTPAFGTFGNATRNQFRGPDYQDVDFALMKDFSVTERLKLQFRSEFFNTFNWTNFGNPGSTVSSAPTFGEILSAYAARQIQFGLKMLW